MNALSPPSLHISDCVPYLRFYTRTTKEKSIWRNFFLKYANVEWQNNNNANKSVRRQLVLVPTRLAKFAGNGEAVEITNARHGSAFLAASWQPLAPLSPVWFDTSVSLTVCVQSQTSSCFPWILIVVKAIMLQPWCIGCHNIPDCKVMRTFTYWAFVMYTYVFFFKCLLSSVTTCSSGFVFFFSF